PHAKAPLVKGGPRSGGGILLPEERGRLLIRRRGGSKTRPSRGPICPCKTVGAAHRAARAPFLREDAVKDNNLSPRYLLKGASTGPEELEKRDTMKENSYDNPIFFQKYSQMLRSTQGLEGAGEWRELQKLLPDFS